MRKLRFAAMVGIGAALASCGSNRGGVFANKGPDEFLVARQQPLVIPPDFTLTPPKPGAPRPQDADSSTQALQALFGGQAPRSPGEQAVVGEAGGARAEAGIRSQAGDPDTTTVDKGAATRDILNAPATQGQEATVSTAPAQTPPPQ